MAVLSAEHKKQLRYILEQYAHLTTHWERKAFLEDAELRSLESRLDMNAEKWLFCYQLVTRCEETGKPASLSDDALLLLLRYVRNEVGLGHEDKVAQIDAMITAYPLPRSNPIISTRNTLSIEENLWEELLQAEEDEDWDAAINIGERIRDIGYKIRDGRSKLAHAYMSRGILRFNHNIFKNAIIDYSRAIELNPQNVTYYWNRAQCYQKAKRLQHSIGSYLKSIEDYSKCLEFDPHNSIYYRERGTCYYNSAISPSSRDNFANSILDYTAAIELEPNNAKYYSLRSLAYHTAAFYGHSIGDFIKSIEDISRAIDIEPQNANYYDSRGKSYHQAAYQQHPIGDYVKAIDDKSRAIELEPINGYYYHSRAKTYQLIGNQTAAQADFDTAEMLGYKA